MEILNNPDSLSLLGNLKKIIVNTTSDISFILYMANEDGSWTNVLQHTYSPSDLYSIEIDLKNVIAPLLSFKLQDTQSSYLQPNIVKDFKVEMSGVNNGSSEPQICQFRVLRAGVDRFDGDVVSFLTQNFLTWQPNVKQVAYLSPEFLTYYATVDATIRCLAHFEDGTTQMLTLAEMTAGQCMTIPTQYATIAGSCDQMPIYYDVWAENANEERLTYVQRYVPSDMKSEEEVWVLFENSLGGMDTFRAYGDSENTAEHTHNVAEIEDNFEEYRVDTVRKYKKNTGYLDQKERLWLLDFFPSIAKYVYVDSSIRRIVVTESDVTYQEKELPSTYTFTYKYAEDSPYLNLPRTRARKALNVNVPELGSLDIAPRLAEYPRLQLSSGALFPVQNPYSEEWTVTTIEAILSYLLESLGSVGSSSGSCVGHSHANLPVLASLGMFGKYLLANSQKIYAALADEASKLTDDSQDWLKILRKDVNDVASGAITFMRENFHLSGSSFGPVNNPWGYIKEMTVNGIRKGIAWFANLIADEITSGNITNSDSIKTKNLVVTGLAHFFELVIDRARAVGGAIFLTPAEGFVVVDITGSDLPFPQDPDQYTGCLLEGKTLYFKAGDSNGKRVSQTWKPGDQALCRSFHSVEEIQVGQASRHVSNKYYWAVVHSVSENTEDRIINGETVPCHWITIYGAVGDDGIPNGIPTTDGANPIPCDGLGNGDNGNPLWDGNPMDATIGDEIVMLGYRGNDADARERRAAVYLSAYNALDTDLHAPFLAFYHGINDFNLSSHRKTFFDARDSKIYGKFYALSSSGNDDDLATSVEKILSDDFITGGDAKMQLRQRWDEMVAEYVKLQNQQSSLNFTSISDDNERIYRTFESSFYYLHVFLDNNYSVEGHTSSIIPSWIADENLGTSVNLADADLISGWNAYARRIGLPTATNTLATVHNTLWSTLYNAMGDLERAINAYQMDMINNIASDDIITAKEKAMLRQMFANEVAQYFDLMGALDSFNGTIYKTVDGSQVTVTIDELKTALNALGTYLNNGSSWKVAAEDGDASGIAYWDTYPSLIDTQNNVASTTITSAVFNEKWEDVFNTRQTLSTDIANARQKSINDMSAEIEQPHTFVLSEDPLQRPPSGVTVKVGDYWYEPQNLTDPITHGLLEGDYYNQYICYEKTENNATRLAWRQLYSAQAAVLSVTDRIYQAVFSLTADSSILQLLNSITETVNGRMIGGRNLLLNTDFKEREYNVPKCYEKFGNVYLALGSTDEPAPFTESLLVTVNEAGKGLCIPSDATKQPNLMLEDDADYILSFYVKLADNQETVPTIQVRRGNPANAVVIPDGSSAIPTTWKRLCFTIKGDGQILPMYITKQGTGSFRIVGLQLEKGNLPTDWRRAEEDWQGQIDLTKDQINLRVTKDGLEQAGVRINGNNQSVTIIGKKTEIEGDLDLQGLTTENVTVVGYDDYYNPVIINMGEFMDPSDVANVTVKSVQFKARNEALNGNNTSEPRVVALPFYDSIIEVKDNYNQYSQHDWKGDTILAFPDNGVVVGEKTAYPFRLFENNGVHDSKKWVMAYRRNGTRLTIVNEADTFTANWPTLLTHPNSQYIEALRGNAVMVCADPRIIAYENIEYDGNENKQLIPNETEDLYKWNAGLFFCGGYQARFIALLPGQSLQLRSQIMRIDTYQEVLVWVVENPSEFVPMTKPLSCNEIMIYDGSAPTYSPTNSHRGIDDCWMGHPVLNLYEGERTLNITTRG